MACSYRDGMDRGQESIFGFRVSRVLGSGFSVSGLGFRAEGHGFFRRLHRHAPHVAKAWRAAGGYFPKFVA